MNGQGRRGLFRTLFSVFVLAPALAAAAQSGPEGAAASKAGFYDEALFAQAAAALNAGETERALSLYCAMLRPPRQGDLWTVGVVLYCDASDLRAAVAQIERPSPVFVQSREFEGRRCYRVCAGLTTSRVQASRWVSLLPAALQPQGPFPVKVILPCSKEPAPEPEPAPAAPPTPRPGREFLGPPVKAPPEPTATSPGMAPAPVSPTPSAGPAPVAKDSEAQEWFKKGLEAYRQDRRLDAYSDYNRALTLEPDRPEILNNLGVLYLEDRRFAEAQPLFEKAVRLSPAYASAHLNLAGALWGLKRFDDAIQEAREAAVLDSNNVNAYLTLSSFFLATGRKADAAQAAKHALELDPKSERAQVFLEAAQSPH